MYCLRLYWPHRPARCDFETLIASIERELLPLPDETIVYSGHGPETTIGTGAPLQSFLTGAYRIA